jgi:hypothetical protein
VPLVPADAYRRLNVRPYTDGSLTPVVRSHGLDQVRLMVRVGTELLTSRLVVWVVN